MGWRTGAVALAALVLLAPPAAQATLGKGIDSVQTDQSRILASRRILDSTPSSYTVHEMTQPNGTLVREYVDGTGTVFGVAWQGPYQPDLRQLFGDYFAQYVDAAAQHPGLRSQLTLQQPGLVVRTAGHPRAFFGHAYIPSQLPVGLTPQDIK